MENNTGAIIIDSNKEELAKLTKKWKKIQRTGKTLYRLGTSGFVLTLLSPFDIEGPVAEVVASVVAVVGFSMKTIAKNKLEDAREEYLDSKDEQELNETIGNFTNAMNRVRSK